MATSEHGTELPGRYSAAADATRETAVIYLIIWAINFQYPFSLFIALGFGLIIWKMGRSAILGWNRLERLHRVIEEERFEIEHHREQEKEELREMYAVKGFSGKQLDEIVDVLMSDDNRLLRVMLEEELGLSLEVYEHPLKQATGALLGTLLSSAICTLAQFFWPSFGIPLVSSILVMIAANMAAKYEKRDRIRSVIWNLALALFTGGAVYFLVRLIP